MTPVLIYDGTCGFCTAWAERARCWWQVTVASWQRLDAEQQLVPLGVTPSDCAAAVQWVGADGQISSGEGAWVAVLRHVGGPWKLVAAVASAPGIRRLTAAVYRTVASNRHRLPGGTPTCSSTSQAEQPQHG